jgi:hypothetical protein
MCLMYFGAVSAVIQHVGQKSLSLCPADLRAVDINRIVPNIKCEY